MFKKLLSVPKLVIPSFKKLDSALTMAENGYKYMKLFKCFITHFKSFSTEAKVIMGVNDLEDKAIKEPKKTV